MQKFMFIEAHPGGSFGLESINPMLEQGWKVIDVHASRPSRGDNIHALVLIEKDDLLINEKSRKQKIISLNQGSGSVHDAFNDLLNEGWVIKQMQTESDSDGSCCFVWLEKEL